GPGAADMRWIGGGGGVVLLAVVLWDAFETIILPRRVSGRIRLTKMFYRYTWAPWRAAAGLLTGRRRDAFLSFYGPLSLIALLALWAAGSVCSFGLLQWAAGSARAPARRPARPRSGGGIGRIRTLRPWSSCSRSGSAGPPTCSRATCRIRRSAISGRSTTTSHGWRLSRPSWTRARS